MALRHSAMTMFGMAAAASASLSAAAPVAAQHTEPPVQTEPVVETGAATTVDAAMPGSATAAPIAIVPAGTFIMIQLDAPVTSRSAVRGDMFPISLAEPVKIDGVEVIPAGLVGEGQVVHSAGTGFGGRAGELIVAARYLTWNDRRIPLRGMRISAAGRNNTAEAIAASAVLTVAGLFITGTSVDLPSGQIAVARFAEAVPLEAVVAAAPTEPASDGASSTRSTEVQQGGTQ